MKIKVSIVEDEPLIKDGIANLLNSSEGFVCEHTYSNAEDAILDIPYKKIDVVLMDIHLPGMSGIECVEKLKPNCPKTQFVMFTSFEETENVFQSLKVGAAGYLTKTSQSNKILDAIVDVYNGGSPMSSHIARKVVDSFVSKNQNTNLQKLTIREQEILDYLSKGYRYKEISNSLFLSTDTVRTHIRNIYEKLQVNSRVEALNKVRN